MSQRDNIHQGIAGLNPYQPGKPIDELARELGLNDIVKLASNENPRGPSAAVVEALKACTADLTRYPDGGGFVLKQALAGHLGVGMNQLTLGNGSNDVLDLIARLTLEPGYQAIVAEHCFIVYPIVTCYAGADLVVTDAQAYGADLEAMLDAITDRTRTIFLANPNNPTGTWVDSASLTAFLDQVPERVWVVLDEAYTEYVDDAEFPDGVALLSRYPNLIVTRTFSKAYGLASLRVGYSVSTPEVADLLNRARQPFNCSSFALAGATAALADQDYVRESVALNRSGMAQLCDGLTALGMEYIPSVGNFVTVDCRRSGPEVFQALLKLGVIARPVAEYGLPNHLRVTVGTAEENARFLTAFGQVMG
ncbi:MAG: histidinol-phosphate transaminase [Pseudomonadales bacterium]